MAMFLKLMASEHCQINLVGLKSRFICLSKIRWDRLECVADSKDNHLRNVSFRENIFVCILVLLYNAFTLWVTLQKDHFN